MANYHTQRIFRLELPHMSINTLKLSAAAVLAILAVPAAPANAVVYCKYIGVPKGCVAKPGVVLVPAPATAPVVRATPGVGAPGVNTPYNRGGPVNRVGRR